MLSDFREELWSVFTADVVVVLDEFHWKFLIWYLSFLKVLVSL